MAQGDGSFLLQRHSLAQGKGPTDWTESLHYRVCEPQVPRCAFSEDLRTPLASSETNDNCSQQQRSPRQQEVIGKLYLKHFYIRSMGPRSEIP